MGIANYSLLPFISCCLFLILSDHSLLSKAEEDENDTIADAGIANSTNSAAPAGDESRHSQFKPGIAALVAILTISFSILFLLLLYIRHCRRRTYAGDNSRDHHPMEAGAASGRGRRSGVDRKVIQSLPMFRFSSLRGQKEGLECAVCLSRFEADEVMRLLPKCKHAFHVECIDTWLEGRSTCPLCRYRVDPEDLFLFDMSNIDRGTPRISSDQGKGMSAEERGRSSSLEIIVENPGQEKGRVSVESLNAARRQKKWMRQELRSWSLQESWKPSRWKTVGRKDGELPVQAEGHRLEHRIVVSGREGEEEELERGRRWSDAEAAEILYLRTEMILERRGEEEEEEEGNNVIKGRSVSEMTGVSRYRSRSRNSRGPGGNGGGKEGEKKAGVVNRWLSWISQSQQNSAPAPAAASTSAPV